MTFDDKTRVSPSLEQAPDDALRAMVATIVQETLEAEFAQFLGAEPYERTPDRRGYRNGSYARTLHTRGNRQQATPHGTGSTVDGARTTVHPGGRMRPVNAQTAYGG